MKNDKGAAGETSKKKRKLSEVEHDDGEEGLSPVSVERRRRDLSSERKTRREYSLELGEDSPRHIRDWRGASRPREGGYKSQDFQKVCRSDDRHYNHRGEYVFHDREECE
jgi:hypothetical protein